MELENEKNEIALASYFGPEIAVTKPQFIFACQHIRYFPSLQEAIRSENLTVKVR